MTTYDFKELYSVNVNENVEKKNGLTYLSWAYAVAEFFKRYPEAQYEIEKFDGLPYVYDANTGYMVYTKVTVGDLTREMWLPVMDGANKAMLAVPYKYTDRYGKEKTVAAATMFDINKTIMRCLVKNFAMFGLGLYIYAGEDLPEEIKEEVKPGAVASALIKEEQPKATKEEIQYIVENTTPDQQMAILKQKNVTFLEDLPEPVAFKICQQLRERLVGNV